MHLMNIQIIAPSACVDADLIQQAQQSLIELDINAQPSTHLYAQDRYLAGKPQDRVVDLKAAQQEQSIDALWCGRGGTGAAQLLPYLDTWVMNKPLIGYSDSTVLLNYIAMQGGTAIHGPVFQEIAHKNTHDFSISPDAREVLALLNPMFQNQLIHYPIASINSIAESDLSIKGKVLGGNLTTLCSLQGTPWALKLEQDSILLIEDVGEPFYRLERLLVQILQSIDTKKLKAVVMGDFYNCPQKNVPHSLEEIFTEHLDALNIPLYSGNWFGHGEQNRPFWIGKNGVIHNNQLVI